MTWKRFHGRLTLHKTSALASPRSASRRITFFLAADRRMARLTATLLLPTPPLLLVIAITLAVGTLAAAVMAGCGARFRCRTRVRSCEAWSIMAVIGRL